MKKYVLVVISLMVFSFISCGKDEGPRKVNNTKDNIVFAVPFAPVSYPIIKIIEDGTFDTEGQKAELILWKTPDQLKSLVAGGQADIFAVPSNVGATFYNKGIEVKLLNISIWRAIWLISRHNDKKTLEDFKGEEIAMPFRGDMPHIVFMELARKQGLDPEKDFKITYVPSPMDAAKKMIMRRVGNALLIDPAVSMVLEKSKSGLSSVIAPDMYRSVDIQNEWGRLFNTENEIPFAGIMAGAEMLKNPALLKRFNVEYKKAAKWCMQNPEKTAEMVVKYIPQLNQKAVAEAMRNVILKSVDAKDVQPRLEKFYRILHQSKPALIGGKLPDDGFYFGFNDKSKKTIRVTSLPKYMGYILQHTDDLKIDKKQKDRLISVKNKYMPQAMPIKLKIEELAKSIKQKSLADIDAQELEKLSTEYGKLQLQFAEIKTDCRDAVSNILNSGQMNKVAEEFNKTTPYDIGDPLGRMSPVPNYMIDIYHVANINLSDDQTDKLANWSTKRHSNSVLAHSKIGDLEAEVRQLFLNNKPKSEIIRKIKEMESIRHKITVTKTVCRDYMKKEVLKKEQWDAVTLFISNKT